MFMGTAFKASGIVEPKSWLLWLMNISMWYEIPNQCGIKHRRDSTRSMEQSPAEINDTSTRMVLLREIVSFTSKAFLFQLVFVVTYSLLQNNI